jgi:hypothetical protein
MVGYNFITGIFLIFTSQKYLGDDITDNGVRPACGTGVRQEKYKKFGNLNE